MSRRLTWVSGIATAALATLSLTACSPDSPAAAPSVTSASPTSSASPSSTASTPPPTSSSSNSGAAGAAAAAVTNFWAKLDALASNPTEPLSDLAAVARDQALTQWQRNLTEMRGAEVKQVGSAVVGQPTVTPSDVKDAFDVKACVDVSKVNVVDKDGKSVVSPNRLPKAAYTYRVELGNDGRFYVATDTMKGEPC